MSSEAGTHRAGRVGVVVIGRNEGARFARCVASLVGAGVRIVYVDSGSTDGSQALARGAGVEVVELDMTKPFTAARARNSGRARLVELSPGVEFVQFVDGDCEVARGWLEAGAAALDADDRLAAVSGRLRERFPEKTIYNRLADLEWDKPVGEEKSCGGVAMMRASAVGGVGGFDDALIAGEEPELCARLRAEGFRIARIAHEMALHDIDMHRASQWLTRARRHGHAAMEVSFYKTRASRGLFAHHVRSALVWGLGAPAVLMVLGVGAVVLGVLQLKMPAVLCGLGGVVVVLAWIMQAGKIAGQARARGLDVGLARKYGVLQMLAKGWQARGVLGFVWQRATGKGGAIIEFKRAPATKA